MKVSFLLFVSLFALSFGSKATPNLTFDKVNSIYIRSSGPILQGNEVKGYFFFYQTDKIDKKTRQYSLNITDEFLNVVKEVKMVDNAKVSLLESSFDGQSLVFLFYNPEEDELTYKVYGLDGNERMNYSRPVDKKDKQMLGQALQLSQEGTESQFIKPLQNKGFVSIIPLKDGKDYSWEMNFYGSGAKKQWSYAPEEGAKFSTVAYLGNSDSIAFLEVLQREKLLSKNNESHLLGINLFNGRKLFDVLLEQDGYKFLPMNAIPIEGKSEFLVFGQYYDGEDRVLADQSQGLFIMTVDQKGKAINKKYLSWTKELSKFVNIGSNGKVEDIGFLYCHKIIPVDDGGYVIIAEGYKKAASALGIASAVLAQRYQSVTKMVITDLVWLQVKPNFTLEKIKIYSKNKNSIEFGGTDVNSAASVAAFIKAYGGFDYSFTQKDDVNKGFVVGYVDYEKSDGNKGLVFNAISYFNKKVTTDKINLTTKGSRTYVYPAKPGNIMIMEYSKKQKTMDLRFEKLN
ncbi:MAG: DUF6770 family protein [Bacteroidota bacterium]